MLDPAGGVGLLLQGARAQARGQHPGPAGHQLAQVEPDVRAGPDADDHEAAAGGQGVQVGGEVGRADQLEDHVEGAVVEDLAGLGHHGGAEVGHGLVVVGVADAGHHPGPGGGGQLDGGRADPAGGPVHQQPVAQPEAALGEQGVVGGGDHLGEPAGLGPGEPVGDRDRHPLVDHGQLGLAAPADHGHHPVALGEAVDVGADGGDLAGQLQPGDVGRAARRRRVAPLDLLQVGAVEPGRRHPDQQLSLPRLGVGPFGHHQPAVGDRDRPHAPGPQPAGAGSGL